MDDSLCQYAESLGRRARQAAEQLASVPAEVRSAAIRRFADQLREAQQTLLDANVRDLEAAREAQLATPLVERLKLTEQRIAAMAKGIEQIAQQPDPIGQTIDSHVRSDGLRIEKRRVPIGVVLFFYESRPNVTADAAALSLRSGNAVILRGGKEAVHSNCAIVQIIHQALAREDASLRGTVQLVEMTDRALIPVLLKLDRYIDLVIPRGGENLIRTVVAESTIPVLKHFTGNCHIYIDASAMEMAQMVREICVNAKTSYPGGAVCNAVEHILVHREAAGLVSALCEDLAKQGVEIRGDERVRELYRTAKAATPEDWDTEYLSLVVGIRIVDSLDEAIEHINRHGSRHTDAIISRSQDAIDRFTARVDSASIMVNASTRFADGCEYGLGAEIGISTDKLHARGPMGAADLTTYKWIVTGAGHTRR